MDPGKTRARSFSERESAIISPTDLSEWRFPLLVRADLPKVRDGGRTVRVLATRADLGNQPLRGLRLDAPRGRLLVSTGQ